MNFRISGRNGAGGEETTRAEKWKEGRNRKESGEVAENNLSILERLIPRTKNRSNNETKGPQWMRHGRLSLAGRRENEGLMEWGKKT